MLVDQIASRKNYRTAQTGQVSFDERFPCVGTRQGASFPKAHPNLQFGHQGGRIALLIESACLPVAPVLESAVAQ